MKIKLTAVEHELMTILWHLKQGSVRDVMEQLPADRRLAYTSVSTMLRILQKKGVLHYEKSGRTHVYIPKISKLAFVKDTISEVVTELFSGNPIELASYLLHDDFLTQEELSSLKELIRKKEKVSQI
jgi:predicted transcriptional regulator